MTDTVRVLAAKLRMRSLARLSLKKPSRTDKEDAKLDIEAADALERQAAMLAASPQGEGSSADVKPTDGDLWWNPGNDEDGFLHWADAFENANEDGEDYSVELHRARKLPPVWGALVWIDGEQKVKIFATEAEADAARVTEGVKP